MLTDQDMQSKLAEAFREQADPLTRNAVDATGIFRQGARRRHRRVAARAVSVMAAAALAAGAWAAARPGTQPTAPEAGSQPPGVLLDAAIARPGPVSSAEAGMPRYYVIAGHARPVAEVRDSATGNLLRAVPLPAGIDPKLSQIAAAGNDRAFVLALSSASQTRFYLLRLAPGGRSARLAPLPVPPLPAGGYATALALTADGRKLAVAVQFSSGHRGTVEVADLATGAVRTWTTARAGYATQLSWAKGGQELGFFWQDGRPDRTSEAGLWVLDASAAGNDLMSGRRILPAHVGGDDVQSAVLRPDGATVIASVTYRGSGHISRGTVTGGIAELSARTGHPRARCWPNAPPTPPTLATQAGPSLPASCRPSTPPAATCSSAARASAGSTRPASPRCPAPPRKPQSPPPGNRRE